LTYVNSRFDPLWFGQRHGYTMSEPRDLTAERQTVALLAQTFPKAFTINPHKRKPLQIGIHAAIAAALPDVPPAALSKALGLYTRNIGYLSACVAGADRVDINGEIAGTVTQEEADFAALRRKARKGRAARPRIQQHPP
jgi:ProP effector